MPPLLADFTHARPCKPFCEKYLTLPSARTFGGHRGRAAPVTAGGASAMVGLAAADVPQIWCNSCHNRVRASV